MPHRPIEIYQNLSPQLQHEVREEFLNLFQQVIYEYIRNHSSSSPSSQSSNLHSTVDTSSSTFPSGKPSAPIRSKTTGSKIRMEKFDIEIIDVDLGLSGAHTHHRQGFKDMLSKVALGEVGIILSFEVTRLSRNCSDWYPLLDICGYTNCLIADNESVYDPSTPNGRLLLGLKGQLSELELYTLRNRLTAGLLNKANRGELALNLPVGFIRNELGKV